MKYKLTKEYGKSVYDFVDAWDQEEIKNCLLQTKDIPNFELDKIEIQPSSVCQLRCPWCFGKNIRPEKKSYISMEAVKKNIIEALYDADKNPIIMLAGLYGETLLHPEIRTLFQLLKNYKFRFGLYTNGIALTDNLAKIIVENVKEEGKPSFISFDISALLKANIFNKILPKIKKIIELKNKYNANLQVNTPILLTGEKLVEVQEKLLRIGVDTIRYLFPLVPINPNNQKLLTEVIVLKEKDPKRIRIETKAFDKCFVMATSLSVSYDGTVYPCSQTCSSVFKEIALGSIIDKSILEIWHSKRHRDLFKNFNPKKSICRCNVADNRFNNLCSLLCQKES